MLLVVSLAFADIAPPDGYVETCTVERACAAGEGKTCRASFQGPGDCATLAAEGWTKTCQTPGASVWTEVYCRPGAGGAAASTAASTQPAPPATQGGCSGKQGAGGLLLFGGLLGLSRRRGRRTK